jgi:hypothetical protein
MPDELKVGDEIISQDYRFPLVVARVGEKRVMARIKNYPFLVAIPKDRIVWRSPQPPEQIMLSLKKLDNMEPEIIVRKKKRLAGLKLAGLT